MEPGAPFHVRIRLDREKQQSEIAMAYRLFLLMPDHVHAVLSFARDK
jgi:hypothetical protein